MVKQDYIDSMVASFIEDIKHTKVKNSYTNSAQTCKLLTQLVEKSSWNNPEELKELVKEVLRELKIHLPKENCIFNNFYKYSGYYTSSVYSRILKLCKDEIERIKKAESEGNVETDLMHCFLDIIDEMVIEIETSMENIVNHSIEMLHPNQRVITLGKSKTLHAVFKKASKKFPLDLFIMENYPALNGHEMANNLSSITLHTTVISDASCFAIMARMDAVVISAATITADGGIKCLSGCYNLVVAAKHYNVPVYVCAPMFKFSPHYFGFIQKDISNTFLSSEGVMVSKEGQTDYQSSITTHLPVFDFIPPSLISLFITNLGGIEPSQMYRFLKESYLYEECVIAQSY